MTGGSGQGHAPASAGLPGVLQEIADSAGLEAALKLAAEYGGQTVYIPGRVDGDHWLARIVGLAAAEQICSLFRLRGSGSKLLVPVARRPLLRVALAKGVSTRDAARAFRVHERTVWRARRAAGSASEDEFRSRQIDLFDTDKP